MQVVAELESRPLDQVPAIARLAEEAGCDVLITNENRYDIFLLLVLAAEHTQRMHLGTAVAIVFPRSPMVVAHIAWDLQRFSGGRLELGVGTQVKAHIERRFSVPWVSPLPRLREYTLSLRAIWDCFQNGTRLDFRGEHYTFNLMTPVFNPGPLEHPHIPILVGGVNPRICRMAGEMCDGLLLHPICSPRYVREVTWPALREGARLGGRPLEGFRVSGGGFVIAGRTEEELERGRRAIRRRIAFYASTPAYQRTLEVHGWGGLMPTLRQMSRQGQWEAMADLIGDEVVDAFAVTGAYGDIGRRLHQRWEGLLTRVAISTDVLAAADPDERQQIVRDLRGG